MTKADLIIRNGRVFTVNHSQPWAEAIAVHRDRIVFVGSDEGARDLEGPNTKVIDAGGRLILPGFIDAHTHCLAAYQVYTWADLTPASSQGELIDIVRRHAFDHPEHRLVGGFGFRYMAVMEDGRLPSRSALDKVVGDRPVWLMSYDGWTACTNSRFLEIAESRLGRRLAELPGVERDPHTREPTGVFYKTEELDPLVEELSAAGTDSVYEGLKSVLEDMVRCGITSVHDVGVTDMAGLKVYERLRRDGCLKARAYIAMQYRKDGGEEQIEFFEQARSTYSDEWVKVGAVKLFIDGVMDSYTGAMLEPYADAPETTGETLYDPEEFKRSVAKLDKLGFQCITHSCGDRGVKVVLDAYEHAAKENGPRERRHRIEHVELVSPDDVPRFKRLGVVPDMQPTHAHLSTPPFDEAYGERLGPQRLRKSFPWRRLVESGAVLAFSSDWPVADMNPFLGIHSAMTRGGLPGEENAIGLEDAIKGYTLNAAYSAFEEGMKGSLEVGKLAEIVILSENLFEIPVDDIKKVGCVLTIVGGIEVYRSDRFRG